MVMSRAGLKLVEQDIEPDAWIAYIVDNPTDGGFDSMIRFFNEVVSDDTRQDKYRLLTAAPGKVSQYVELEGADLVAYEVNREWERYITSSGRPQRHPMFELTNGHWHKFDVLDGYDLQAINANPMSFLYPME